MKIETTKPVVAAEYTLTLSRKELEHLAEYVNVTNIIEGRDPGNHLNSFGWALWRLLKKEV